MSVTSPDDSWEGPSAGAPGLPLQQRRQEPVKDDWDDDDEDSEDEDPQKVWEDANTKAPMPEVVIAPASAAAALPVHALQPAMRILRRPSAPATPSPSSTPTAETQQKSLAEREAQYRAARDRIFGSEASAAAAAKTAAMEGGSGPSSPSPGSSISAGLQPQAAARPIRSPRGPDAAADSGGDAPPKGANSSRGFRRRGTNTNPRNMSSRGRQA